MFQYEELREEVQGALEEVLRARKEAEEQTNRILDAEGLEEAKQLYLIHQVCVGKVGGWCCQLCCSCDTDMAMNTIVYVQTCLTISILY